MAELIQTPEELIHLRTTYVLRGQSERTLIVMGIDFTLKPDVQRCSYAASRQSAIQVADLNPRSTLS